MLEFHVAGKRGAAAYAQIWLQHLTDNEETPVNIPIWTTKHGDRLTQNYITEQNWKASEVTGIDDLEEIGRLQFRARFKAGMDESHRDFIVDNESRETYETWEACVAEGVRDNVVEADVPKRVHNLHENSLLEGRDILKQASPEERKRWISKSGKDWFGAFGEDSKAYTNKEGGKTPEPDADRPPQDHINPSDNEDDEEGYESSDDSSDIGIQDAANASFSVPSLPEPNGEASSDGTWTASAGGTTRPSLDGPTEPGKANRQTEKRKHRGLMQWRPARNAQFAKDGVKFGLKKVQRRFTGHLGGREPQVKTETGQ